MAPAHLQVVVLGEDPLARSAVRAALTEDPGLTVVATAAQVSELPPGATDADVVVWDLGLAPERALDEGAEVLGLNADVVVLAPDAEAAQAALASGVRGVVTRDAEGSLIAAAVRAVRAGLSVTDPRLLPEVPSPRRRSGAEAESLTHREREVLSLVVEGLSNRGIAQRLGISEHTAKFHVNQLLQKLGAQTRTEAVVRAARLGWVTL